MNDVSFGADHDVSVVPVFDVEEVADEAVPGERRDEVFLGLFEPLGEHDLENVAKAFLFVDLFEVVDRVVVGQVLDDGGCLREEDEV